MKMVAKELGETINIGIHHEGQVVTLHSEEGEKSVLVSRLIPVAELHCSSMGKLVLAEMEAEERQVYFKDELIQRTVNTMTTLNDFEKELEEIKRDHLAHDREEYEYGLSCIAAPIYDEDSNVVAMVSVSGPTTRLEFKGMDKVIKSLKELVVKLEKEI